ncbi:MAG: hypothetical protein SFV81_19690 [Pirellulaceae bacterium]|nr:hypothetical protein [Pirellulaceae bacterium]
MNRKRSLMDNGDPIEDVVGDALVTAHEQGDLSEAHRIIRANDFMVLQQFDPETGEVSENDDGSFNVVLVEVEEDTAVVAFTQEKFASEFLHDVEDELPEAENYPAVMLDGNTLLDGLPEDCGLLINPGAPTECYFPPGLEDDADDDDSE